MDSSRHDSGDVIMRQAAVLAWMLPPIIALVAGCATAYDRGHVALDQGRWTEAATRFEETLVADPDRVEALLGLGVARYKLGALDEATSLLQRAVAQAPQHPAARLYLGLAALQRGDTTAAAENLAAFRGVVREPRMAAQVDRALDVLRLPPPPEAVRRFMVASLEDAADSARELARIRQALREHAFYSWPYPYPYDRTFSSPWRQWWY
jgi:tetratricopeptide (TPR) repeat protein